jgi:hypothetical protein
MLSNPVHHRHPFPYFLCHKAFSAVELKVLERTFASDAAWQSRDEAFYRCSLREVTEELPAPMLHNLAAKMRDITGLPLMDRVVVTSQRMDPGQAIGVHSDQPWVGYELVRLVVQLNADWHPDHGGELELYEAVDHPPVMRVEPVYGAAFGFVLHEGSLHGVRAVTRPRRSLVFNFWHPANSPALGDAVRELFSDVHVGQLPPALDSTVNEAEATLPEEETFRATLAALAAQQWGYDTETVVACYRHSAGLPSEGSLSEESRAAIRLADWVSGLHEATFDLARWRTVGQELGTASAFPRLASIAQLCFPSDATNVPESP